MDFKNLRCFLAVAEHLNFSRAAQSLYLSQPALSLRINALEEEMGAKLFFRTHQQVYLTPAGSTLLPAVREILSKVDDLPALAKSVSGKTSTEHQRLKIGVDRSEDRTELPYVSKTFSRFGKDYPLVEIDITTIDFSNYESKLLSKELDLCLMIMKDSDSINPVFSTYPTLRETILLVTSGGEDLSDRDLLRSREILLLEGDDRWNAVFLNFFKSVNISPRLRYVKGTTALFLNLADGSTAAFLPENHYELLNKPGLSSRDLSIPDTRLTYLLLWNKTNLNPALQLLVNEFGSSDDA
jgi:DNA-binding transcriptional LysR family regulator